MAKNILDRVVEEIKMLEPGELLSLLHQLNAIIDSADQTQRHGTMRQTLRNASLLTSVRRRCPADIPNRPLIHTQGKAVSETIIEDRR